MIGVHWVSMDAFERELKSGFLEEADQLLSEAGGYFLTLEFAPTDSDTLAKLYRVAHNLKGSGGAVGFNHLGDFSQKLEALLGKLKAKELHPDPSIVQLLLKSYEYLRLMIVRLKDNLEAVFDPTTLVDQIKDVLSGNSAALVTPVPLSEISPSMDEMDRELKLGFLQEARQLLAESENYFLNLEESIQDPREAVAIYRIAHNIKGSAGAVGFQPLSEFAYQVESLFAKIKNNEIRLESTLIPLILRIYERFWEILNALQVDFKSVFKNNLLMQDIVDYLALPAHSQVQELVPIPFSVKKATTLSIPRQSLDRLVEAVENNSSLVPLEIQEMIFQFRRIRIGDFFQKMVQSQSVDIHWVLTGDDIEMDRLILEQMEDPFLFLIREILSMGIKSDKKSSRTIRLSAYRNGGCVTIEFQEEEGKWDGSSIFDILPGDISGRARQMLSVKTLVTHLQGEIQKFALAVKGVGFRIVLPFQMHRPFCQSGNSGV